jgi:hypothetical protein
MDQPGPDAPEFAPQEQQQPKAYDAVHCEDEPLLREATDQADKAGREGQGGNKANAPIGETRGHKSLSFSGAVRFFSKSYDVPGIMLLTTVSTLLRKV